MNLKTQLLALLCIAPVSSFLLVAILVSRESSSIQEVTVMDKNLSLMQKNTGLLRSLQAERESFFTAASSELLKKAEAKTDEAVLLVSQSLADSVIAPKAKEGAENALQSLRTIRTSSPKERSVAYKNLSRSLLALDKAVTQAKTGKGIGKIITSIVALEEARESLCRVREMIETASKMKEQLPPDFSDALESEYISYSANSRSPVLCLSKESTAALSEMLKSQEEKSLSQIIKTMDKDKIPDWTKLSALVSSQSARLEAIIATDMNQSYSTIRAFKKESVSYLIKVLAGLLVWLVIVLLGSLWLYRRITGSIGGIATALDAGAAEMAAKSHSISDSSRFLADGSSNQAAAIEQTSASIEEMSGVIMQNAENARQAKNSADAAFSAARSGISAMEKVSESIAQMKNAADKTARIIKTIDEIAFQTNLLALNAAVEAARAGESGKGFAVVAEEVRSLAQRSARAAKDTENLIQESVNSAENGVKIGSAASAELHRINSEISKVNSLISEIAAAGEEQSKGISQISQAVQQIELVIQSNAHDADEFAEASEALYAQIQFMEKSIATLALASGGRCHINSAALLT